jgi:hypothetical protein
LRLGAAAIKIYPYKILSPAELRDLIRALHIYACEDYPKPKQQTQQGPNQVDIFLAGGVQRSAMDVNEYLEIGARGLVIGVDCDPLAACNDIDGGHSYEDILLAQLRSLTC